MRNITFLGLIFPAVATVTTTACYSSSNTSHSLKSIFQILRVLDFYMLHSIYAYIPLAVVLSTFILAYPILHL